MPRLRDDNRNYGSDIGSHVMGLTNPCNNLQGDMQANALPLLPRCDVLVPMHVSQIVTAM